MADITTPNDELRPEYDETSLKNGVREKYAEQYAAWYQYCRASIRYSPRLPQRGTSMARIDKFKEEIGWLKIIFAILIATGISLCAWVVQNYGKISKILLIISVIGVFLLTICNCLDQSSCISEN